MEYCIAIYMDLYETLAIRQKVLQSKQDQVFKALTINYLAQNVMLFEDFLKK